MKVPVRGLHRYLMRVVKRRPPDVVIGVNADGSGATYLERWWLIRRNDWFNVYLHHFRRSDDDRALHDHPYFNMSLLLEGSYYEVVRERPGRFRKRLGYVRRPGDLVFRLAATAHRIELYPLCEPDAYPSTTIPRRRLEEPVWSLFITGPRVREWGFRCSDGWRPHKEFMAPRAPGQSGRGCE